MRSVSSKGAASSEGTAYSSLAHAPRSISLHRSEQKGRNSFPVHSTGLRHLGQVRMKKAVAPQPSAAGLSCPLSVVSRLLLVYGQQRTADK